MADVDEDVVVSDDGETSLPVMEVVTGRGFVTGKSGSGKSNTASVLAEELLDRNIPLLIVDTDGEYYGLKESYELLHVGADQDCDVQVGPQHAEAIAMIALEEHVPVILDVSGYLEGNTADDLIKGVTKHLFAKEKELQTPFLLLVEEVHEFIPEQGGLDDLGEMLIRVAKRGRKRGLGMCGLSQRPAAVDKDFITQCDWLIWHRLTWENDTRVVAKVLGQDIADDVPDLNDGQAFMMTDWDGKTQKVQFRRKRTFDAGATPGLEDFDRPELKTVSNELISRLQKAGEGGAFEAPDEDEWEGDDGDGTDEATDGESTGGGDSADGEGGDGGEDEPVPTAEDVLATANSDSSTPATSTSSTSSGSSRSSRSSSRSSRSRGRSGSRGRNTSSSDGVESPAHALWEFGRMLVFLVTTAVRTTARALDALGHRTVRLARQIRGAGPIVEVVGGDEYGTGGSGSPEMHSGPVLTRSERKRKRPPGIRGKYVAIGITDLVIFALLVWALAMAI